MCKKILLIILSISLSVLTACGGGGGGGGGSNTSSEGVGSIVISPNAGTLLPITVIKSKESPSIKIPFTFHSNGTEVSPDVKLSDVYNSDGTSMSFEDNNLVISYVGASTDFEKREVKNISFTLDYTYNETTSTSQEYTLEITYEGVKLSGLPASDEVIELRNTLNGGSKDFTVEFELPAGDNYTKEIVPISPKVQKGVSYSFEDSAFGYKLLFITTESIKDEENFNFSYNFKTVIKDKFSGKVLSEIPYEDKKVSIFLKREAIDDIVVDAEVSTPDNPIYLLMGKQIAVVPYSFKYKGVETALNPKAIAIKESGDEYKDIDISFSGSNLEIIWNKSDISLNEPVVKKAKYIVEYEYNGYTKRTEVQEQVINFIPVLLSNSLSSVELTNASNSLSDNLVVTSPDSNIFPYKKMALNSVTISPAEKSSMIKIECINCNDKGEGSISFSLADGIAITSDEILTVDYTINVDVGKSSGDTDKAVRTFRRTTQVNLKTLEADNVKISPEAGESNQALIAATNIDSTSVTYKVTLKGADVSNNLAGKGITLEAEAIGDPGATLSFNGNILVVKWDKSKVDLDNPAPKNIKYRIKRIYKGKTISSGVYTLNLNFTPIKITGDTESFDLRNAEGYNYKEITPAIFSPADDNLGAREIKIKSTICPEGEGISCTSLEKGKLKYQLNKELKLSDKDTNHSARYEVEVKVGDAVRTFTKDVNIHFRYDKVDEVEAKITSATLLKVVMPIQKTLANYEFKHNNVPVSVSPEAEFVSAYFIADGATPVSIPSSDIELSFKGNDLEFTWKGANDKLNETKKLEINYNLKYKQGDYKVSKAKKQLVIFDPILLKIDGLTDGKLSLNNIPNLKQELTFSLSSPSGYTSNITASCDAGNKIGIIDCKYENNKLVFNLNSKITNENEINVKYTVTAEVNTVGTPKPVRVFKEEVPVKLILSEADEVIIQPKDVIEPFKVVRNYNKTNSIEIPYDVTIGGVPISNFKDTITLSVKDVTGATAAFKADTGILLISWSDDGSNIDMPVSKTVNYKVAYKYKNELRDADAYSVSITAEPIKINEPIAEVVLRNAKDYRSVEIPLSITHPLESQSSLYGAHSLSVEFTDNNAFNNDITAEFKDGKIIYTLVNDINTAKELTVNYKVTASVGAFSRVYNKSTKITLKREAVDDIEYKRTGENTLYVAKPLTTASSPYSFTVNGTPTSNIKNLKAVNINAEYMNGNTSIGNADGVSLTFDGTTLKYKWDNAGSNLDAKTEIRIRYAIEYSVDDNFVNVTPVDEIKIVYEPIVVKGFVNSYVLKNTNNNTSRSANFTIDVSDKVTGAKNLDVVVTNKHTGVISSQFDKATGMLTVSLAKPITETTKGTYQLTYNVIAKVGNAVREYKDNQLSVTLTYVDIDKVEVNQSAPSTVKVLMSEHPVIPFSFMKSGTSVPAGEFELSAEVTSVDGGSANGYSAVFDGNNLKLTWNGSVITADNTETKNITYNVVYKYKNDTYSDALTKTFTQKVVYEPVVLNIAETIDKITLGNADNIKTYNASYSVKPISTELIEGAVTVSMNEAVSSSGFFSVSLDKDNNNIVYKVIKPVAANIKDTSNYEISLKVKSKSGATITRTYNLSTEAELKLTEADKVTLTKIAGADNIVVVMPNKTAEVKFDISVSGGSANDVTLTPELSTINVNGDINSSDVQLTFENGILKITWINAKQEFVTPSDMTLKYSVKYTYKGSTKTSEVFTQKVTYVPIILSNTVPEAGLTFKNKERTKTVNFKIDSPTEYVSNLNVAITDADAANMSAQYSNGTLTLTLINDITPSSNSSKYIDYTVTATVGTGDKAAIKTSTGKIRLNYYLEDVEFLTVDFPNTEYSVILPNSSIELPYKFRNISADVSSAVDLKIVDVVLGDGMSLDYNEAAKTVTLLWSEANNKVSIDTNREVKFKLNYAYNGTSLTSKDYLVYKIIYMPLKVEGLLQDQNINNDNMVTAITSKLTYQGPKVEGSTVTYSLSDTSSTIDAISLNLDSNNFLQAKLTRKLYKEDDGKNFNLKYTITAVLKDQQGLKIGERVFEESVNYTFRAKPEDGNESEDLDPVIKEDGDDGSSANKTVYNIVMPSDNEASVVYSFKNKLGEVVTVTDFAINNVEVSGTEQSNVSVVNNGNNVKIKWNGEFPSSTVSTTVSYKYTYKYGRYANEQKPAEKIESYTVNFIPITFTFIEPEKIGYGTPQQIKVSMSPSLSNTTGTEGEFKIESVANNFGNYIDVNIVNNNEIELNIKERYNANIFTEDIKVTYKVSGSINKYENVGQNAFRTVTKTTTIPYEYVPAFRFSVKATGSQGNTIEFSDSGQFEIIAGEGATNPKFEEVLMIDSASGDYPSCNQIANLKLDVKIDPEGKLFTIQALKGSPSTDGGYCSLGMKVTAKNDEDVTSIEVKDYLVKIMPKFNFLPDLEKNSDSIYEVGIEDAILVPFKLEDNYGGSINSITFTKNSCDDMLENVMVAGSNMLRLEIKASAAKTIEKCQLKATVVATRANFADTEETFKINVLNYNIAAGWGNKKVYISPITGSSIELPIINFGDKNIEVVSIFPNNLQIRKISNRLISITNKNPNQNFTIANGKITIRQGAKTFEFPIYIKAEAGNIDTDPISIYSPEILKKLAEAPDTQTLSDARTLYNKYYKLVQDDSIYGNAPFNMDSSEFVPWTPIGRRDATEIKKDKFSDVYNIILGDVWSESANNIPFTGNFNGDNITIKGLVLNGDGIDQGLFGYVFANRDNYKPIVVNTVLEDVSSVCSTSVCKGYNIGSLVGYVQGNDTFNTITTPNSAAQCQQTGSLYVSHVKNSKVSISNSPGAAIKGGSNVGGAVGAMLYTNLPENIIVRGNVYGSGDNVGGVIGLGRNLKTVTPYGEYSRYFNTCGQKNDKYYEDNLVSFRDNVVSYKDGTVEGNNNVGGYAGRIFTYYANYMVPAQMYVSYLSTENAVVIANGDKAGGLIGWAEGGMVLNNGFMQARIALTDSWTSNCIVNAAGNYTGGMVGDFSSTYIDNAYYNSSFDEETGIINSFVNNLVVASNNYTGGIIGGTTDFYNGKTFKYLDYSFSAYGVSQINGVYSKSTIVNSFDLNGRILGAGSNADNIGFVSGQTDNSSNSFIVLSDNLIYISKAIETNTKGGGIYPGSINKYVKKYQDLDGQPVIRQIPFYYNYFIIDEKIEKDSNGKYIMIKALGDTNDTKLSFSLDYDQSSLQRLNLTSKEHHNYFFTNNTNGTNGSVNRFWQSTSENVSDKISLINRNGDNVGLDQKFGLNYAFNIYGDSFLRNENGQQTNLVCYLSNKFVTSANYASSNEKPEFASSGYDARINYCSDTTLTNSINLFLKNIPMNIQNAAPYAGN